MSHATDDANHATTDPTAAVPTLTATVSGWPAVRTRPSRFGGTTFSLGGQEIGHVHNSGVVDIAFPRRVRDRLIEAGHTGPHQFYPDSGWTTFRPDGPDAVERATWLLRLSYLYHARAVVRRPSCEKALAELDPEGELAAMDPTPRCGRRSSSRSRFRDSGQSTLLFAWRALSLVPTAREGERRHRARSS